MLAQSSWSNGPLVGLDYETTGTDVESDRIVSAALLVIPLDRKVQTHTWLIDPGVEIPAAATAVHGVSTAQARDRGRPPAEVLGEIFELLEQSWTAEIPLITFNGSYDLSIMDREGLRHLGGGLDLTGRCMIDGLIVDREVDRYRKGPRKLGAVCRHYGIPLGEDAHHADADTLAAMRLAWKLANRYPDRVGNVVLPELHANQQRWHHQWGRRMAEWLDKQAGTLGALWRSQELGEVRARLAKLEITEEPNDDLIELVCKQTRDRAEEFRAAGSQWPICPRPA